LSTLNVTLPILISKICVQVERARSRVAKVLQPTLKLRLAPLGRVVDLPRSPTLIHACLLPALQEKIPRHSPGSKSHEPALFVLSNVELLQIAEATGSLQGVQSSGICPEDQPHEMDQSATRGSSPIFDKSRSPTPIMATDDENTASSHSKSPFFAEFYPGASKIFGSGPTFMDNFDNDQFSKERQVHSYYPFASKDEWQMASFLLRSDLSMAALDQFFKLELVGDLISFISKSWLIISR
jgi:hypothetical protein